MLCLGGALGYWIAYARFWNARIIDELREQYRKLTHEFEHLSHQAGELTQQNRILKQKAHQLLQENEDYSKMVSQLSRYYYHIKQAAEKVTELVDILWIEDDDIQHKLMRHGEQDISLWSPIDWSRSSKKPFLDLDIESDEKSFF